MWECVCVDICCGKVFVWISAVGRCLCGYLLWEGVCVDICCGKVFVLISTCGNMCVWPSTFEDIFMWISACDKMCVDVHV